MIECLCMDCKDIRQLKMKASHVERQPQEFMAMPLKGGIHASIIFYVPVGKHVEFTSEVLQPLRELLDMTVDHFRDNEELEKSKDVA